MLDIRQYSPSALHTCSQSTSRIYPLFARSFMELVAAASASFTNFSLFVKPYPFTAHGQEDLLFLALFSTPFGAHG